MSILIGQHVPPLVEGLPDQTHGLAVAQLCCRYCELCLRQLHAA